MTVGLRFQRRLRGKNARQDGYILLTLLFVAAATAIFLAAVLPKFSQQMRRDREEELVHRGVQYSRAIRRYYKKFGRYPVRLEDLENTNNIRFLRKRYKDPITGKDFKILHFGEVKMAFGPGIAGAAPVAQSPAGGLNASPAATVTSASFPTLTPRPNSGTSATNSPTGSLSSASSSSSTDSSSTSSEPNGTLGGNSGLLSSSSPSSQVFGGGPIVGVVSSSTKQSIREFNKKDHYNDWQFIYDPSTDRGGLLNTPAQPALQPVGGQQNPANAPPPGGGGAPGLAPPPIQPPPAQQPPQQMQPQQMPPDR